MANLIKMQEVQSDIQYAGAAVGVSFHNKPVVNIVEFQKAWERSTLPNEWILEEKDQYSLYLNALEMTKNTSYHRLGFPESHDHESDDTDKYYVKKGFRDKNGERILAHDQILRLTSEEVEHTKLGKIDDADIADKAVIYLVKDDDGNLEILLDVMGENEDMEQVEMIALMRRFYPFYDTLKNKWEELKAGEYSTKQLTKYIRQDLLLNNMRGINFTHSTYLIQQNMLNHLFELQNLFKGLSENMEGGARINIVVFPIPMPQDGVSNPIVDSYTDELNYRFSSELDALSLDIQKNIDSESKTQDRTWMARLEKLAEYEETITQLTRSRLIEAKEFASQIKALRDKVIEQRNKAE